MSSLVSLITAFHLRLLFHSPTKAYQQCDRHTQPCKPFLSLFSLSSSWPPSPTPKIATIPTANWPRVTDPATQPTAPAVPINGNVSPTVSATSTTRTTTVATPAPTSPGNRVVVQITVLMEGLRRGMRHCCCVRMGVGVVMGIGASTAARRRARIIFGCRRGVQFR